MVEWKSHNGYNLRNIGPFLQMILIDADQRPAKQQINERYRHGGGWHAMKGWKLHLDKHNLELTSITYPGDPPQYPLASAMLNAELVILFPHDFLAVVQPNGNFEISRID